tara:strand:- start:1726 stop:2382 length:657 start_codon:yes stop_codon:yes gene_type:complete
MRINYIDHFDSFANTIAAYMELAGAHIPAEVVMYKSNCDLETAVSGKPDLILLGSGPNGPKNSDNYLDLLDRYHEQIPFFGICLGFQTILEYFGEEIVPLNSVMHGESVPLEHNGAGIFYHIPQGAEVGRYNSLGALDVPPDFEITATSEGIIMAAKHRRLPIEGVQFHPESILSNSDSGPDYDESAGKDILINLVSGLAGTYRNISFFSDIKPRKQT